MLLFVRALVNVRVSFTNRVPADFHRNGAGLHVRVRVVVTSADRVHQIATRYLLSSVNFIRLCREKGRPPC